MGELAVGWKNGAVSDDELIPRVLVISQGLFNPRKFPFLEIEKQEEVGSVPEGEIDILDGGMELFGEEGRHHLVVCFACTSATDVVVANDRKER